jgi:hypothetical protein
LQHRSFSDSNVLFRPISTFRLWPLPPPTQF